MGPNNVYELSFIEIYQKYATYIELLSPEVVSCFHEIAPKSSRYVSQREARPQTAFHARIFKHVSELASHTCLRQTERDLQTMPFTYV